MFFSETLLTAGLTARTAKRSGPKGVDIIERGVEVKPPFHVAEHHLACGRDRARPAHSDRRSERRRMSPPLIHKCASASRPSGEWNVDDFDVLGDGAVVGRIFKANASPVGASWMWILAFWHHVLSSLAANSPLPIRRTIVGHLREVTTMIDLRTAKILGHRRNIQRCARLLAGELTELEREYLHKRIAEEHTELERLQENQPQQAGVLIAAEDMGKGSGESNPALPGADAPLWGCSCRTLREERFADRRKSGISQTVAFMRQRGKRVFSFNP
jgi:hypothetical protein